MLDLNRIQSNPEELREMLKKRCMEDTSLVDRLNVIIQQKKKLQTEVETLRAERNKVSKEIGIIKSKGGDIQELSNSMKDVGNKIKELEEALEKEETNLSDLNLNLPNFLDPEVPFGKSEEDNVEVYKHGVKPEFSFAPKPHFEIGEALGIFDFEKGVKLAGGRAYTYFGKAAKLERALMNFMLNTHGTEHGYEEVWVPMLVNDDSMKTTGQYPKFKDEYYRLDQDGLSLIPTAEVPLTNLYRDEIIPEDKLPISIMAHTSCFRREAGSHGRDTRGLVRVHQFQKVELVKFTKPEDSEAEHRKMLTNAENILKKLGLHYRVLLLCSKDTSNSSSKTFDIEVWMPGLNRYMEISSVSNFKDFQARRGKIRYKSKEGKNQLVHTINGSGLAIGRTLAAIVENYQTESGDFTIPDALQRYI
ncbi:MAG TPA: serine--tRNA ligase [Leptospiraceae bacterium]|nr:serine--tRNA ligase [Leptospiraceae bacterium]HMW07432.1 serine--tRNA ligase [Leptospiraceae bacterium]HMX32195.1 serine--tRNA ligase [Leptospiraceae bacterium]HMY33011.1 serine--tRNA ligase [Leptospiraceae bacterium]HMZ63531.1 serine--tRNA ligase [Leptospiraceae bacterium]